MLTTGIDWGSQTVKVVVFDAADKKVLSKDMDVITDNSTWEKVFERALDRAGCSLSDIDHIVSSGVGGKQIKRADTYLTDVVCGAKGAVFSNPSVRRIVDIGAEKCLAMSCDENGKVQDFVTNDKCASGTGMFLDTAAGMLQVKIEDIGELSLQAKKELNMDLVCAIFAESEIVSQIHKGEAASDILKAIHTSICQRAYSLLDRLGTEQGIMAIGGVAQNVGMLNELKAQIGDIIVCEDPCFVTALGAAISAE